MLNPYEQFCEEFRDAVNSKNETFIMERIEEICPGLVEHIGKSVLAVAAFDSTLSRDALVDILFQKASVNNAVINVKVSEPRVDDGNISIAVRIESEFA